MKLTNITNMSQLHYIVMKIEIYYVLFAIIKI